MRKLVSLLTVLFLAGELWASGGSLAITNVSQKVLPAAGRTSASSTWTTNAAYSQGEYVVTTPGQIYMCLVAGTSTNVVAPPASLGDVQDGTVTWRRCLSRPRKGLVIQNVSTSLTAVAWINMDGAAASNRTLYLGPNGSSLSISGETVPQGEWHAVIIDSAAIPGRVNAFEW